MHYFLYFSSNGEVLDTKDEIDEGFNLYDIIYKSLFSNFNEYWFECNSTAELVYMKDDELISHLSISAEYSGISLHYTDSTGKDILSISDMTKLNEIITAIDDIHISVGLFIPVEPACEAIKFFLDTGRMSEKINGISTNDLPDKCSHI